MLWYKAWRESRARFLLSATTLAGLCVLFVLFHGQMRGGVADHEVTYAEYVWRSTYKGYLRELFVGLTVMLGVGGLLRERGYGTAAFTLALPVSRSRLVASRALVGLAEVTTLALLPVLLLPALSPVGGQHYALSQALGFAVLWVVGGALFLAIGFLASSIFGGEYSALVAAFSMLTAYSAISDLPVLEHHFADMHDVMSGVGMRYFRMDTFELSGRLPWMALAMYLLVVAGMVWLADRLTQRMDF